jgi:hypothetical protein
MPSGEGRHAIELLADDAGLDLPTTQWPLPRLAVQRAIDKLPDSLPPPLAAARERVRAELRAQLGVRVRLDVADRQERLPGFDDSSTPGSWASARTPAYESDDFAAQVGGRIEAKPEIDRPGADFRLDETTLATEAWGLQFQAWARRSWWSPGWQNALALSNNAPAFIGLGFQRASASTSDSRWLSWMGPWNFEAFLTRTEDVSTPGDPMLIGMRLTLKPSRYFELGLTSMAQWGGRGRPQSFSDFLAIFTRTNNHEYHPGEETTDASNGLAGFDWRVRCPSAHACSFYGQLIGEDESGNHMPMKYLGMYGLDHWSADGTQRYYLEYVESTCRAPLHHGPQPYCAYRNYLYPEGYTSGGRWIGTSLGPDSHVATLGWLDTSSRMRTKLFYGGIGTRYGNFSPEPRDPDHAGPVLGLDVQRTFRIQGIDVMPHLIWTRTDADSGPHHELGVGVQFSMDID